jgi:hypothetical protein
MEMEVDEVELHVLENDWYVGISLDAPVKCLS